MRDSRPTRPGRGEAADRAPSGAALPRSPEPTIPVVAVAEKPSLALPPLLPPMQTAGLTSAALETGAAASVTPPPTAAGAAVPEPAPQPGTKSAAEPEPEWEALMAAAQRGDARAYDGLLRAMLPFMRRIVRRRITDPAEAEDAVQDALLTVHRLRHTYDPARPLRPWLAAIAERRAIDRLRRRSRRSKNEAPAEWGETIAADTANRLGDSVPEARLAAAELRRAVADLPESQRTALALAKLQGLPLAEASARSGLSIGALKIATHRALRALRQRLAPGHAGAPLGARVEEGKE